MLRAVAILALVIAATAAPSVGAVRSPPSQPTPKEVRQPADVDRDSAKNKDATDNAPLAVYNQTEPVVKRNTTQKHAPDPDEKRAQDAVTFSAEVQAASAAIIVLLTIAMIVYSHKGWAVAKVSADAAKKSADVARDALYAQRAHLIATKFTTINEGPYLCLQFEINNTGATPAELTHGVICWMVGEQLPEIPDYSGPHKLELSKAFAYTGTPILITIDLSEEQERIEARFSSAGDFLVVKDSAILFVFGCIEYNDIWGKKHSLGWAREYVGSRQGTPTFWMQNNQSYEYTS